MQRLEPEWNPGELKDGLRTAGADVEWQRGETLRSVSVEVYVWKQMVFQEDRNGFHRGFGKNKKQKQKHVCSPHGEKTAVPQVTLEYCAASLPSGCFIQKQLQHRIAAVNSKNKRPVNLDGTGTLS